MMKRRQFLIKAPMGVLAVASADRVSAQVAPNGVTPAGAPPVFGNAPAFGPEVSTGTFLEAEKLMQVQLSEAERRMASESWPSLMAGMLERRTGPRKTTLESTDVPATQWNPVLPGIKITSAKDQFVRSQFDGAPLPVSDREIAFAPVSQLSRWIHIYLDRIARFNPTLRCVITVTAEHAMAQAQQADREIAAGKYRGPLHGIPYGVKDLLDTAGIATTYGAEPFRHRIPAKDSAVVQRLNQAGAVLIAKLSLGALALNDVWFGGQTMNPWLPEEGASGSSAGPGSATAAGLVAFSIGSETGGSIVSPSMRCGVTGLRPTYGRVPRTGAMTLCWSLDKL